MIRYTCPECGTSMEVPVRQGGQEVHCFKCGTRTTVPVALVAQPQHPVTSISAVTIPILVSAIGNAVFFYIWFFTCVGIILAIPMAILCIFEFVFYAKAPRLSIEEVAKRATTLAIFEILIGLFNLVSLVCGILVLVQVSRLRAQIPEHAATPSG